MRRFADPPTLGTACRFPEERGIRDMLKFVNLPICFVAISVKPIRKIRRQKTAERTAARTAVVGAAGRSHRSAHSEHRAGSARPGQVPRAIVCARGPPSGGDDLPGARIPCIELCASPSAGGDGQHEVASRGLVFLVGLGSGGRGDDAGQRAAAAARRDGRRRRRRQRRRWRPRCRRRAWRRPRRQGWSAPVRRPAAPSASVVAALRLGDRCREEVRHGEVGTVEAGHRQLGRPPDRAPGRGEPGTDSAELFDGQPGSRRNPRRVHSSRCRPGKRHAARPPAMRSNRGTRRIRRMEFCWPRVRLRCAATTPRNALLAKVVPHAAGQAHRNTGGPRAFN